MVTGGVTDAMPGVSASAVLTVSALAAVEITWTGSPEPAGKYLACTFCALTEGGVPRNAWAVVSVPILKPIRPAEPSVISHQGLDSFLGQIAGNGVIAAVRACQCHVAVGTHEIHGVALETGRVHGRLPREYMQRDLSA